MPGFLAVSSLVIMRRSGIGSPVKLRNARRETAARPALCSHPAIYISFQSYLPSMPINQPFLGTRGRDAWFLGGFFPGNHAALRYWKSGQVEKCTPRNGRETSSMFSSGYICIISKLLAVHADNQPFLGTRGRDAWFLAVSSLVIMRRFRYWKSGQVEKCTPRNGRETSSMFSSGYICIISKLLAVHADNQPFLGTRGRDAWFLAVSPLVIMRRFRYWKSGQVEKCTPRNGRETSSMFSSGYICIISKLLAVHADNQPFLGTRGRDAWFLAVSSLVIMRRFRYWKSGQVEKCTPRNGRETSSMFSSGYICIISKLLAVHADNQPFLGTRGRDAWFLAVSSLVIMRRFRYWKSGQVEKCTPRNGRETSSMFSSGYICIISKLLAVQADNQPFLGTRGRDAWFLAVSSLVIMRRFRYWKSGQVEKCTPRNGRETSSMFSSGYICIISKLLAVHADNQPFLGTRGRDAWFLAVSSLVIMRRFRYWKSGQVEKCTPRHGRETSSLFSS